MLRSYRWAGIAAAMALSLLVLPGCKRQSQRPAVEGAGAATGNAAAQPAGAAPVDKVKLKPVKRPLIAKKAPNLGQNKPVTEEELIGGRFSGVARVQVSSLLETPKKYVGKVIALVGDVATKSSGGEPWFSMTDDKSGARVRVFTAPRFLPPEKVVGLAVKVEGKPEIIKTPVQEARRLKSQHKIPFPAEVKGDTYSEVILRGMVARFR